MGGDPGGNCCCENECCECCCCVCCCCVCCCEKACSRVADATDPTLEALPTSLLLPFAFENDEFALPLLPLFARCMCDRIRLLAATLTLPLLPLPLLLPLPVLVLDRSLLVCWEENDEASSLSLSLFCWYCWCCCRSCCSVPMLTVSSKWWSKDSNRCCCRCCCCLPVRLFLFWIACLTGVMAPAICPENKSSSEKSLLFVAALL